MKKDIKLIKYIIPFFLLIYTLPILFTTKYVNTQEENEKIVSDTYNYGDYNTIKVLIKSTNEVKEMHLDEYLKGVVASEMPASYESEALKAQAVVARTYTLYKIKNSGVMEEHNGAHICDDSSHCQAWLSKEDRYSKWSEETAKDELWNKICIAVDNTKGEVITYEGQLINAFFHANSGGTTESSSEVWGGNLPYLQAVATSRRKRL